jgi:hypothetical protein
MLVHDVFHVSLIHPYAPNTLADQIPPPPLITIVDGNIETDVETILDSRTYRGELQYRVRWVGLPPSEDSWEPAEHVTNAETLVAEFHHRYPNKPKARADRRSDRHRKGGR